MVEILKSVFLGVIQGLTEFLPVSSSAHLNFFPWVFGWEITESFDLGLHIGTLMAIFVYFFKDFVIMVKGGGRLVFKKEKNNDGKIFWYLVIATIPAGILALLFEKMVDLIIGGNINALMIVIAFALIIMGIVLYIVDKNAKQKVRFENLKLAQVLKVSVSQALAAAVPGVSRSGITMTVARILKLDRESSARLSFLLSAPMVLAAVIFNLNNFKLNLSFLFGILASFVSGILVIKFLLDYLRRGSYKQFAIYRIIIGVAIIGLAVIRM
ncbi:MAG: undecaprenyl-diphosphate phosphatase [Clostridia bacterium]|nr:undecaprenyl-diphosphate phosphatase [Clostridia bacterium]